MSNKNNGRFPHQASIADKVAEHMPCQDGGMQPAQVCINGKRHFAQLKFKQTSEAVIVSGKTTDHRTIVGAVDEKYGALILDETAYAVERRKPTVYVGRNVHDEKQVLAVQVAITPVEYRKIVRELEAEEKAYFF